MDTNNTNFEKDAQNIPKAADSTIFGTSSSDIVQGLQAEAFTDAAVASIPGDDDQIVNEEDQQEITNQPEEEVTPKTPETDSTTLQNIPGIEKDLLDKNILEDKDIPGEANTNDIKAT